MLLSQTSITITGNPCLYGHGQALQLWKRHEASDENQRHMCWAAILQCWTILKEGLDHSKAYLTIFASKNSLHDYVAGRRRHPSAHVDLALTSHIQDDDFLKATLSHVCKYIGGTEVEKDRIVVTIGLVDYTSGWSKVFVAHLQASMESFTGHFNRFVFEALGKAKDECTNCNRRGATRLCGRCFRSNYCTESCRQIDWIQHQFYCMEEAICI